MFATLLCILVAVYNVVLPMTAILVLLQLPSRPMLNLFAWGTLVYKESRFGHIFVCMDFRGIIIFAAYGCASILTYLMFFSET